MGKGFLAMQINQELVDPKERGKFRIRMGTGLIFPD